MKKFFLFLSFALIIGMTSAFASNDPNVSARVQQSFKREFPSAEYVTWDKDQDYLKASFVLADYRAEAWFSGDGQLLGTIRDLLYNQLPLAVMKEVDKKFSASNITEIREITNSNGTTYKMVVETRKGKFNISATPDGEVTKTGKIKN
jgi:hypothetical protein